MSYVDVPLEEVQVGDILKFTPAYTCKWCKKEIPWQKTNSVCPKCLKGIPYEDWFKGGPRFYRILAIEGNLAQVGSSEWTPLDSERVTFGRKVEDEHPKD